MAPSTDKISDERFLLALFDSIKGAKMEWETLAEQCSMRNGKAVQNRLYNLRKRIEASEGSITSTPKSGKKANGTKATSVSPKKRSASGDEDADDEESTPLKAKTKRSKKAKLEGCEEAAVVKAETGSDDGWA